MVRWGLVGCLWVLAACGGRGGSGVEPLPVEGRRCPDVRAGPFSQGQSARTPRARGADDADAGRQAVLLRHQGGAREGAAAVERAGGQVTRRFHHFPWVAARLTAEQRARLEAAPEVETLEPDGELRALGSPVRVGAPEELTEALRMVQAPQVWDADEDGVLDEGAPTGEGIRVCIIDSGIDPRHPELQVPYVGGHDFVDDDDDPSDRTGRVWGSGHGTHVAGTLAAQLGSGARTLPGMSPGGVVGVAPGVELLIARVLDLDSRARVSTVLAALEWCQRNGARIVNLSLGGPVIGSAGEEAFQRAADAGMLIVAASGNGRMPGREAPRDFPAAFPSVVAVGAVDGQEELAPFSNRGPNLDLVAPGVGIVSSIVLGEYKLPVLEAGGRSLPSIAVAFAPEGDYTGELVDCGEGDSLAACQGGTCDGFVAYVRPGTPEEAGQAVEKVMLQGARAVVLGIDASEGEPSLPSLGQPGFWVPTVAVGPWADDLLRARLGEPVRVRLEGVDYVPSSGTSMATPHVAGVAALVWSARPSLTAAQVRALLETTAKDLGEPGRDEGYGFGLVQAREALDRLPPQP